MVASFYSVMILIFCLLVEWSLGDYIPQVPVQLPDPQWIECALPLSNKPEADADCFVIEFFSRCCHHRRQLDAVAFHLLL